LGPRFIELDRLIRNTDPLLMATQKIMPQLYHEFGGGLLLLSSLYGDKVLCIHQEPLTVNFEVSYTRGRPMPLFYGATSKIILANLPERRLVKLFLKHRIEISKAGLGEEWDQFKNSLQIIRDQGFCVSRGEVDSGVTGIGAAIFADGKRVIGSLTYVVIDSSLEIDLSITSKLNAGCDRISDKIFRILNNHDNIISGYSQVIPLRRIKPKSVA
jgi:DNA-binding IclR family transcriptional regulator